MNKLLWLVASSLTLAGCGGGGGGGSSGSNAVSESPVISVASDFETTEYNAQYGLGKIKASDIYADGYSGSGVIVGVIDTGVDIDHPDLVNNIASGGCDYVDGNSSCSDTDASPSSQGAFMSHGTHVAGIIAGTKNNVGMHGVAYNAKILPLRAGNSAGSITYTAVDSSIDRAISKGAKVINASFGGSSIPNTTAQKWLLAHNNDIVTVHAAGNNGGSNPILGAQLPYHNGYTALSSTLIAVVATNSSNTIASYSNRCGIAKNWCMAAPGDNIYSTVAVNDSNYSGNYGTMSGTSMADPHVSGAIAVLRSKWPSKSASQVVSILYDTATDIGATGIDVIYGRGLLNLDNALYAQGTLSISLASGNSYSLDGSVLHMASNLSGLLNNSLSMTIFDKYQRDYPYDLNRIISPQSELTLSDELSYKNSASTADMNGLILEVNAADDAFKIQTKLNNMNVRLGQNTNFDQLLSSADDNIQGLSEQYSLSKNEYLSSVKFAKSIGVSKSGVALGVSSGYTDRSQEHSVKGVNLSISPVNHKNLSLTMQLSHLEEEDTFLSNYFSGAYKTGQAKTNIISLVAKSKLAKKVDFIYQHAQGVTQVDSVQNSVVENISSLKSQSYSATLVKKDSYIKDDMIFASIKQPLQITQGNMTFNMAQGLNSDDSVIFEDKQVSLSSKALKNEMTLGYSAKYTQNGQLVMLVNRVNNFDAISQSENQFMIKINQKF